MKKRGVWTVTPVILLMGAALLLLVNGCFFPSTVWFFISSGRWCY